MLSNAQSSLYHNCLTCNTYIIVCPLISGTSILFVSSLILQKPACATTVSIDIYFYIVYIDMAL